jgi:hypothetical protein
MNDKTEVETTEILSNYIAVTALEGSDKYGLQLPNGQGLMRTPAGNQVESDNYPLLLHMVGELEEYPVLRVADGILVEPRPMCSYLLYSTQRDFVDGGYELDADEIGHMLHHDPVLHPTPGPEWTDQLRAWEPLTSFLASLGAELKPLVHYFDYQGEVSTPKESWTTLVEAVAQRWQKLSPAGKAVVLNLHPLSGGHFIAAVAVASRVCTDIHFGHAVLAASPLHHTFGFPNDEMTTEEQHSNAFRAYRDLARVCCDYMRFFPPDTIALMVGQGESKTMEFKSTLRWDIRQEKKSDDITHASLKTIAAFLNTEGGTLLIGVADDGTAVGIGADQFPNDDKFMLHLYTVIKSSMGTDVTRYVQTGFDMYEGKRVCVLRVKKSERPVYLKVKGKDEEFFVRTGPSSEKLAPSDLVQYISEHFKAM